MEIKDAHLQEFVKRAKEYREAQKAYMRSKTPGAFVELKIAEGFFDKALTWFDGLVNKKEEPGKQGQLIADK